MQVGDNDELVRFREEWKAEVRARAITSTDHSATTQPPAVTLSIQLQQTSIELYRRAVQAEEQGQLDEALALYRRAFRRNPNVDKLYHREEIALASTTSAVRSSDKPTPPGVL